MNIFQQYGIKEVMNACLYAIQLDENENEIYVPVLYLDTLKVSTVEQSAQSVSSQGGQGNPKLITWDYGKEIKVQLEDALCTPAQQSLSWTGKLGAKGLKLYLRNFEDRAQQLPTDDEINEIIELHPEWAINLPENNYFLAYKEWLNSQNRGATLEIQNFSDFCIIPDRNVNKNSYVGRTSIYCWLCNGFIITNDDQNKILVKDLILFYREQTQKWYFYNGKGPLANYTDFFDKRDVEYYAVGYQYGKDTFEWIKEYLARTEYELRSFDKWYYLKTVNNAPIMLICNERGSRGEEIHQRYYGNLRKGIITLEDRRQIEADFSEIYTQSKWYADSDNDFYIKDWLTRESFFKTYKNNVYIKPDHINSTTPSGAPIDFKYDEVTNRYYLRGNGTTTVDNLSYQIYIPVSNQGEDYQDLVNFVFAHYVFGKDIGVVLVNKKDFDWEPVSTVTRRAWDQEVDQVSDVDSKEDYDIVNFLTQNLYIDGYKTVGCPKDLKYSDDIPLGEVEEGEQPCRYQVSIDVEYNSNIVLPQEALYQIEHGFENVNILERIEECVTKIPFCINTDTNLKHGEQRYLPQYAEKELTVFINPKTMLPYVPNAYEYWTKDHKRITGNLRIFKKGEIYYKWTRTKAKRCESLGSRLIIDKDSFPGVYRFVGETRIRDRDRGKDYNAQFEIMRCKLTANNDFQLRADGDPVTFNMELSALPLYDDSMMKITFYETDDKVCDGSTRIIPEAVGPDFEEVNADWDIIPDFEVNAPEVIDLAAFLLPSDDDSYMQGLNKKRTGDD